MSQNDTLTFEELKARSARQVLANRRWGRFAGAIWAEVLEEVDFARAHSMYWPVDLVQGAAIMVEEAGEVLQKANEVAWQQKDGTMSDVRHEVIQTMAMCVRFLEETPGAWPGAEPALDAGDLVD